VPPERQARRTRKKKDGGQKDTRAKKQKQNSRGRAPGGEVFTGYRVKKFGRGNGRRGEDAKGKVGKPRCIVDEVEGRGGVKRVLFEGERDCGTKKRERERLWVVCMTRPKKTQGETERTISKLIRPWKRP